MEGSVLCYLLVDLEKRNEVIHHGSCPSFDEGVAEVKGIVHCILRAKEKLTGAGSVYNSS